jgi:hypothetical protein
MAYTPLSSDSEQNALLGVRKHLTQRVKFCFENLKKGPQQIDRHGSEDVLESLVERQQGPQVARSRSTKSVLYHRAAQKVQNSTCSMYPGRRHAIASQDEP